MDDAAKDPEVLSDEWVASHNARVMANRARFGPLVAGITDDQARMVVDLGMRQGQSMNRVAVLMRPHLDWEIPDEVDIMVGTDLYVTALERLGLHDADFRPFPERFLMTVIDGVEVHYTTDRRILDFEVDGRRHEVRPSTTVRFGLDVTDVAMLQEAIEAASEASPSPEPPHA